MTYLNLSTSRLDFELSQIGSMLGLQRFGLRDSKWTISEHSPLFSIYRNYEHYDNSSLPVKEIQILPSPVGTKHCVARFLGDGLEVDYHIQVYDDTALVELWPVIRNTETHTCRITQVVSASIELAGDGCELIYYDSDWGREFQLRSVPLSGAIILETRAGRSSKGKHPWFALQHEDKEILSGSIAWSGNWIMRFEPAEAGMYRISLGLSDWKFAKELQPGKTMDCPHAIFVLGHHLNSVSQQYAHIGREFWYPHNILSKLLPVEWNPWWSYEDFGINAGVFRQNVDLAHQLGIDLCTLDAGWFGDSYPETSWYDYRGDWDRINLQRFPESLSPLADYVHTAHMSFGVWCEIEGLGRQAKLSLAHPEFIAQRDAESLGYICFGNPDVREWAFMTLSRLITEFNCDWIKLDFNLDPGEGCNRTDHGHGAGDGLYEHYQGYYQLLERIRQAFPQVVLENCSSGGLRIDLALIKNIHLTFLSDPDWPDHALQVFWGATTMLAPDVCLRWSFSEWCNPERPAQQTFNPRNPHLTQSQLDYYVRIAMLGVPGFSQRLPDLPVWVAERISQHIRIYQDHVRPFVRQAVVYRLTDQPQRDGTGPRWCAFQYSLPLVDRHLVFVFRLSGAEREQAIRLQGLISECTYTIAGFEDENWGNLTGKELMSTGIIFNTLEEPGSALLHIY